MIDRFYPKKDNLAKLILGILSDMPRRRRQVSYDTKVLFVT